MVVMARERLCTPVPQVLVQAVQAVQAVTTQSTGHRLVAQLWMSPWLGQTAPPWAACTFTLRLRDWVPLPQVFVHVLQLLHA